jgi:hypothetical protein
MSTEKIEKIVGRVLHHLTYEEDSTRNLDIESTWCRIIDSSLKAHSYVVNMKDNALWVRVDSSCYLAECNIRKKQLIQKLNRNGFGNIRNIKFTI